MHLKKITAAVLTVTMLLPVAACNKEPESEYSLSKIRLTGSERSWSCSEEKYAGLLETYGDEKCNGTLVVATDEDIVYLYAEDAVEKDGTTPVSQDTIYDIASLSKTFTAVCILQLMEKGKLTLDDTLDKYFPGYETGKNITIYDLLHMSSGIPDYLNNPDPFWNISGADAANKKISDILMDRITDEEFKEALYQAPLEFEPGSAYGYSNTNYRLLAFIIEQISGKKYCDYVKKNIFDKCGMKKTTSMAADDLTYVPYGYEELVEYGFANAEGYPACPNNSRGDGGIHSCLTDMVAFDRALFGGKLLSEKSMEILLKEENNYCCGLIKNKNGYTHSGSSLTCEANNKIVESGEFGHIYVIMFSHMVKEEQPAAVDGNGSDPMAGTKFTPGTYKDRVYTNEYAELKMTVPERFDSFDDSELSWYTGYYLSLCTDDRDKLREAARKYEALLYDGSGATIEISYINTASGVPDDPDYTEEDYLDDYVDFMTRMGIEDEDGWDLERIGRTTVNLGGKEYVREEVELDFMGKMRAFYYARKIDDDLMCAVQINIGTDESIGDYEKWFE